MGNYNKVLELGTEDIEENVTDVCECVQVFESATLQKVGVGACMDAQIEIVVWSC